MANDKTITVEPKPRKLSEEFGVTQDLPFTTSYSGLTEVPRIEEYDYKVGPSPTQLYEMRRVDGQARALYRLITLPIRAAMRNISFVPHDDDKGEAEFIEQMFTLPARAGGMKQSLEAVMAQILLAVFDGFSAFEMVYNVPKEGPLKNKVVLSKLAYRPARTLTFLMDEFGDFAGFRQVASFDGRTVDVLIPKERAFYFAANEEERPFYGVSYFESAFYHFDKKIKLYFISHLAAQRSAVGTRVGTFPDRASDTDRDAFKRALANLGVAQHIAKPEGYDVANLSESSSFDFLGFINHHNNQMSKSVLATFFDQATGGSSSDTSLVKFGEQEDDLFILMLQTLMSDIARRINEDLIPKFVTWNFGSYNFPEFRWGDLTEEQRLATRQTFDKLATAGPSMNVTKDFMFELEKRLAEEMGLELDYEKIQMPVDPNAQFAQQPGADPMAADPNADPMADPNAAAEPAGPQGDQLLSGEFEGEAEFSSPADTDLLGLAGQLLNAARDTQG